MHNKRVKVCPEKGRGMYLKKDRESCIQGKRGKNTWGNWKGLISGGKPGGKGKRDISRERKGRCIREREGDVYQA